MSSKRPKIYFTAPNGVKIEMNALNAASVYMLEQVRSKIATEFRVPKDMLFPAKVTVSEGQCLDVALTDELRAKGSVEVKFEFNKE